MVITKSTPPLHVLALLDFRANSCFMDRNFAQDHPISLRKLPCPASVVVIDGRPTTSGNIIEETEFVNIVLDNLACVISLNIKLVSQNIPLFWDYHGSNYITQT